MADRAGEERVTTPAHDEQDEFKSGAMAGRQHESWSDGGVLNQVTSLAAQTRWRCVMKLSSAVLARADRHRSFSFAAGCRLMAFVAVLTPLSD